MLILVPPKDDVQDPRLHCEVGKKSVVRFEEVDVSGGTGGRPIRVV